jgi:NADH dehydrogenase [ubiquinone] 1 alpha subcomplex assembly factor 5
MTQENKAHNPHDAARLFDRALIRLRRNSKAKGFAAHAFLAEEIADSLIERLSEVNRQFKRILILGDASGKLGPYIEDAYSPELLVEADFAENMIRNTAGLRLAASEEYIPFAPLSFDLIISNLTLHWVNDLPGALMQLNRILKPDGLFLAAFFGGTTLTELRQALTRAEIDVTEGLSPRVSPFADIRDCGGLLQRAGFALPLVDSDSLTVTYANAVALMHELRGMGEANALNARQKTCPPRAVFLTAAAYSDMFGLENGRIPATFQVLYLTGWSPDASQPKPLAPGSAKASLAKALKPSK